MSGIFSGAMAAGLLASIAMVASGLDGATSKQSLETTAEAAQLFQLQVGGDAYSCVVERGAIDMMGEAKVTLGTGCDGLYAGLADARFWNERADGTVALTDAAGSALIEFSVADGAAYQTFQPGAPLASLIALN